MKLLIMTAILLGCVLLTIGCRRRSIEHIAPEDEIRALFRRNAETALALMKRERGVDLKFDAESLALVEDYLLRHRTDIQDEIRKHYITVFGSYLGETVIAVHGGEWIENADQGWGVKTIGDITGFPFAKVTKLIDNGAEDSITSFLRVLPSIAEHSQKEKQQKTTEPSVGGDGKPAPQP